MQRYIVENLVEHPTDIASVTARKFGVTRQAVNRHLRALVEQGALVAAGETRSRTYEFAVLGRKDVTLPNGPSLQEDEVWKDNVAPLLTWVPTNVRDICHYGVTEIVNNAKDHSGSPTVGVSTTVTLGDINVLVTDEGIGIFRKIKDACGLEDERHAIFELVKGKLTTDPARHTGEGIFFASRMFDAFDILSGSLYLSHSGRGPELLLDRSQPTAGTHVGMRISPLSSRTTAEVFDRYATDRDDYAFSRTHVVVALARSAGDEKLVSRSQARRVLARLDRFKEIVLDFRGIDTIGPAFADEIFRVFQNEHPEITFTPVGMADDVARMIRRARSATPPSA